MKLRYLLLITYSTVTLAQEPCLTDLQPFNMVADPSSPMQGRTCTSSETSTQLKAKLLKKANATSECDKCPDPFGDLQRQTENGLQERKRRFITFALDEMKKNMSETAMDLMKIRSLRNNGLSSQTRMSCNFSNLPNGKCKGIIGERAIKLFQTELANELNNIVKGGDKKPALFLRIPSSCEVSDEDAVQVKAKYAESQLTPETIAWIKQQKLEKGASFDFTKLKDPPPGVADLETLSYHPLFKSIFTSSDALSTFLNSVKPTDRHAEIVSKANINASATLSESIANRCTTAIRALENICESQSFSKGNVSVDDSAYVFDEYAVADEETKEIEFRNYCFEIKNQTTETLKFSSLNSVLNTGVGSKFKKKPFSKFRSEYFEDNLYANRNILCSKEINCSGQESPQCAMRSIWKVMKEEKLQIKDKTKFSDESVNKVLASMVGDPVGLDPDVRKVLVAERIIQDGTVPEPKHDPSYDPTPANIARDPVYKAGNPNFKSTAGPSVAKQQPVENSKVTTPTNQSQETNNNVSNGVQNTSNTTGDAPDLDRDVASSPTVKEALKDPFNQKLLDRLMKGRQQPTFTRDEVNKIVRQQLAAQNANIPNFSPTTQQVDAATDKFYDDAFNSNFGSAAANFKKSGAAGISRDKLSSYDRELAKSLQQKYAADEAAKKPTDKSSTLGQQKEVKIEAGAIFELDAKILQKAQEQAFAEGQSFALSINIGGKLYEFDVRDLVASPKRNGKDIDPAILKKVNEILAKVPRERQQKLRFLNAILSANNS